MAQVEQSTAKRLAARSSLSGKGSRLSMMAIGVRLMLVALAAQRAKPLMAAQTLPPVVYVCPMAADAAVAEDQPGKCPVCGMRLVPTRLDSKWWCPTHQTVVVRDGPGKCPLDGKALVQVTLSEHWTCADKPDQKLLEPGACTNGRARTIVYELRAHGDHNPHHGGQFFMASDQWHHLEGTYPDPGLFRAYFYDNFTKPIPAKGFSGSLVVLDKSDKEVASFPLSPDRNGQVLEARIPPALTGLPFKSAAKIRFDAKSPDQRFDFNFAVLSKDAAPKPASPAAVAGEASKPARPAGKPAASVAQEAARMPTAATDPQPKPLILDSPLSMPPALAEALDESNLPSETPQLVTELICRAEEIESLVKDGNLAQVWLPAMGTKTVALVLEQRAAALPDRQRLLAGDAVKRIVVAAWDLDYFGDLGDRDRITQAYQRLATAVTDLKAVYENP